MCSSLCRLFCRMSSFRAAVAATAPKRLHVPSCARSIALAFVCLTALSLHAQSADSAGLEVDVHDPTGALLPNATLVLVNHATQLTREGTSDKQGRYRFTDVPIGDYTLTIKHEGFNDLVESGISLSVSQSASLNVNLKGLNSSQQVNVVDSVPLIDTNRTTNGQTISTMEIENLPSNGRNFADFALTVPGVTPQATSGQGSGLSVNGQRGRSNSVMIDGVENNGDLNGTIRQTLPLDAVAQFQVMTSQFLPEYGNAGGGIINLVTKTGTPEYHGDLFYFARNAALNAHPFCVSANCPKPVYVQNDLGATLSGPLPFNKKTVFFGAVEYLGLNTNTTDVLSPFIAADINTILALRPLVGGGVKSITAGGNVPQSNTQTVASLRLDHSFGDKDNVTLRMLYAHYDHNNPTLDRADGTYSDPTNYGFDTLQAYNATAIYTHVFTPNLLNDLHLLAAPQHLIQVPNDKTGPALYFPSLVEIGRNPDFPTILNENHFEGSDGLSWSKGKHLFKIGTDIDSVRANTSFPTDFAGLFSFTCVYSPTPAAGYPAAPAGAQTCVDSLESGTPYQYVQGFGTPRIFLPDWLLSGYIEDSWKIAPRITMNYGLRYDLDLQPQGYNGDLTNPLQAPLPKGIPRDYNNFGPRVALSWAVDKNSKTVIRVGYGIFYDKIFLLVARNTLLARGVVTETTTTATTAAMQFATGPYPQSTSYPTGLTIPPPTINAITNTLPIPYAGQSSIYIDHELGKKWVLELAYINVNGAKELKSSNVNLAPPVIATSGNFQQIGRPTFGTLLNPSYNNIQQVGSFGHSRYNAFQGTIIHSATQNLSLRSSWIWSKEIDDASDFTQAQQPDNPYNPHAERGLGDEDQRNRWAASAVYRFPYFIHPSGHNSPLRWIGGNWTGSMIGTIYSGSPLNITVGSDVNGDGNTSSDRPYINGLNGLQGGSIVRRNAYRGPRQQNVSIRLQKQVPLPRFYSLRFSAEAFNAFNHVNYGGVSTIWGTAATPGASFGNFTSAGSMRAIQLGVKFFF